MALRNQQLLQALMARSGTAAAVPASTLRTPTMRTQGLLEQLQQQYPYQAGRPEMGFDPAAAQSNILPGLVERGMDVKMMMEEPVETGVGLAELGKGALQIAGAAPTLALGSERAQQAARRRLKDNPVAMMLQGGVRELRDLVGEKGVMGALGSMGNRPVDVAEMMLGVVPAGAVPKAARAAKAAKAAKKPRVEIGATDVHDESGGEMFASKILSVDGVPKAGADLSIYGDKVYIQHVQTLPDAQRQGYAKQLIDNLIEEHPDKKIALTLMTDEGQQFFSNTYDIADDMTIAPKAAKAAPTLEERAAAVGYTRPAYHGSTHELREFSINRSNVENHMGQAHYFTTSPKDASANYGGMGPDLTARIRREAEQMDDVPMDELIDMVDDTVRRQYEAKMQAADARIKAAYDEEMALINQSMGEHKVTAGRQVRPPGMDERLQELSEVQRKGRLEKDKIDSELLLEAAKTNLKGPSEGMVYDVQLRLDNPLHIDGSKKEPVFEIETVFDDAGEYVEERGNGIELIEAMHDAAADFDADAERIVREFMEKSGDDMVDGMKASEVDSALRRLDSIYEVYDETTGDNASTEFIRQVYENLGYDSVIMDPAKAFPHMDNVPTGTRHYIVFDKYANKIRSKRAAFDPKKLGSRDIMATVTPIAAPGLTAAYLANQEQE